jgi:hypothetical protein
MKTDSTLPERTLAKHGAIVHGASTEDDKQRALEAMRKFQEEHHPKRVAISVPTWNGKPVVPITSK